MWKTSKDGTQQTRLTWEDGAKTQETFDLKKDLDGNPDQTCANVTGVMKGGDTDSPQSDTKNSAKNSGTSNEKENNESQRSKNPDSTKSTIQRGTRT